MEKISGVYKIVNTVTGDFYVGSSNNIKHRWTEHKSPSRWKEHPNSPMYQDMQKYGVDKFIFQILGSIMPECLKQLEQDFIEMLHPTYNDRRSNGCDVERYKEYQKEYKKEWLKTNKGRDYNLKQVHKYLNQLCSFNGETLTLNTLAARFRKAGIEQPYQEAKKYLIKSEELMNERLVR